MQTLTPLPELANRFRLAHQRALEGFNDWIAGTLEMASTLYEARQQFPGNREFGCWLFENDLLDCFNKNDRAALINMGAHLELTRRVLQETKSTSYRLIWSDEIVPRVPSAGNTTSMGDEVETGGKTSAPPQNPDTAVSNPDGRSSNVLSQAATAPPMGDEVETGGKTSAPPQNPDIAVSNPDGRSSEMEQEEISQTEIDDINARDARIIRSPLHPDNQSLSRKNPLYGREGASEVYKTFLNHHTRTALNEALKGRYGKELRELILAAIAEGFARPTNYSTKTFNAKALFGGYGENLRGFDLANVRDRRQFKEEVWPMALANKEAILANPEKVDHILDEYKSKRQTEARDQLEQTRFAKAVALLPAHEQTIVCYGERFWPIDGSYYDYDQICTAVWYFRNQADMLEATNDNSVTSRAIGVRYSIKWLSEYATYRTKDQKKLATICQLVRHVSQAWEKNPEGECKWPPFPHQEGKW
jgi:hypothetical protein